MERNINTCDYIRYYISPDDENEHIFPFFVKKALETNSFTPIVHMCSTGVKRTAASGWSKCYSPRMVSYLKFAKKNLSESDKNSLFLGILQAFLGSVPLSL